MTGDDRKSDAGDGGEDSAVQYPLDGTLDLHMFHPRDARDLVNDYLKACVEKGLTQVRIVHGKGEGVLRRIVHSVLDGHPLVASYRHEGGSGGSWGATVVVLKASPRSGR